MDYFQVNKVALDAWSGGNQSYCSDPFLNSSLPQSSLSEMLFVECFLLAFLQVLIQARDGNENNSFLCTCLVNFK